MLFNKHDSWSKPYFAASTFISARQAIMKLVPLESVALTSTQDLLFVFLSASPAGRAPATLPWLSHWLLFKNRTFKFLLNVRSIGKTRFLVWTRHSLKVRLSWNLFKGSYRPWTSLKRHCSLIETLCIASRNFRIKNTLLFVTLLSQRKLLFLKWRTLVMSFILRLLLDFQKLLHCGLGH